jgi:hypothetical protein
MKTQTLLERHARNIHGVLECYDRVVLSGTYQAVGWPEALGSYLGAASIPLLQYAREQAPAWAAEVNTHLRKVAREEGVQVRQVGARERKEALVQEILARRGRAPGVICVLGAMEKCSSLRVRQNEEGRLRLVWGPGKCQHFYVYLIDAEFGLCHLRIPTWVPFRLQFCCNGHEWLARQLEAAGLSFRQDDNCFTWISDLPAAQKLVRRFDPRQLHQRLEELAARWVSVHARFGPSLHWSIAQAEWSTDILFKSAKILPALFQEIVRTAVFEIGHQDVYRFLGKCWRGQVGQETSSKLQTLVQGTRLKHSLGETSLKVYDKAGSVLRIECTTRDVTTFTHYRKVKPRQSRGPESAPGAAGSSGEAARKWAPMRKTIYNLGVLAVALSRCTRRYLACLSQWRDQTQERQELRALTASRRDERQRSVRGVNFFRDDDLLFLRALERGEHHIHGLRNRTLQPHLPGWSPAKIGRTLRRLRVLKVLKRVHGTRKYYPTARGQRLIAAGLQLTHRIILPHLRAA